MRRRKRKSILQKTFLFSSLLVIVTLTISFILLVVFLPTYYVNTKYKNLEKSTQHLAQQLKQPISEEKITELINEFAQKNNAQVWPYDYEGNIIPSYSSVTSLSIPNSLNTVNQYRVKIILESIETGEENVKDFDFKSLQNENHLLNLRENVGGDNNIQFIDVISSVQPINEAVGIIISLIPFLISIMIIIGLIFSYFYSKKITYPILQLKKRAVNMKEDNGNIVEVVHSNDELEELSENIDELYENLNLTIEKLQVEMNKVSILEKSKADFMRIAGHELKTPVTALSVMIESMIHNIGKYKNHDRYLIECKKIVDNLTQLIFEILQVSKLDFTDEKKELCDSDLSEMVSEILNDFSVLIDKKSLRVLVKLKSTSIKTDRKKFKMVLSNIISNAIKYTPSKGQIIISASNYPTIGLIIENECEHYTDEEISHFFEPFYTKDPSHNKKNEGTGLGLYIVRKNLDTLGYSYGINKNDLGIRFWILFNDEKASLKLE